MSEHWTRRARVAMILWIVMTAAAELFSATASAYQVDSVTRWMQNASPMGWSASLNRVVYNSRGADGMFDAYSAKPDGSDPRCLTCTMPSFPSAGTATQRGASDVSPDGDYTLLDVERGDHLGQIGASVSEPGKGLYNDVWLAKTDGTQAWPLTNINAPGQQALGTMWARFDRTGHRLVWAELYAPAVLNLGYWRLKVADIVWSNGVPGLANVKTIEPQPGHFYEPYGFSPDDSRIIFASDAGMPSWWDSQIYTVALDGTGLTRLSPADAPEGFFTNYNEFAFYLPHNDQIVYGRTRDEAHGGIDYWVMSPDGSNQQRLTYFNEPWNTQYLGFTVAGGLAFDPNDPSRFVAGVASDMNAETINAVMVNMSPSGGLTGSYFADQNLGQLAFTRTENPSSGFRWDWAPGPGLPASGYSARWAGLLTAPTSGTYSFCVVANAGARLWIANQMKIDAWYSFGSQRCAAVSLGAGAPTAVRLDYWNLSGTGTIQLSWIPPGARTPQIIPAADLSPAASGGSGTTTTSGQSTQSAGGSKQSSGVSAVKSAEWNRRSRTGHLRGRRLCRRQRHPHAGHRGGRRPSKLAGCTARAQQPKVR